MKPSLDPACAGGGEITVKMTHQGQVEAYTHMRLDAQLLAQQLGIQLYTAQYLWTASWVCLTSTMPAYEALCNLGTFSFVESHLLSKGGR